MRIFPLLFVLSACTGTEPGTDTDLDSGSDTDTAVTAEIGPDGGRVDVAGAYIDIPAGALAEDTEIEVLTYTGDLPDGAVTTAYELRPHGLQFSVPVEFGMDVASDDITLQWSEDGSTWAPVATTIADGIATTQTSTFSYTVGTEESSSVLPCSSCQIVAGTLCLTSIVYDGDGPDNARTVEQYSCDVTGLAADMVDEGLSDADNIWNLQVGEDGAVTSAHAGNICLYAYYESGGSYNFPLGTACDASGLSAEFRPTLSFADMGDGTWQIRSQDDCLRYVYDADDVDEIAQFPSDDFEFGSCTPDADWRVDYVIQPVDPPTR